MATVGIGKGDIIAHQPSLFIVGEGVFIPGLLGGLVSVIADLDEGGLFQDILVVIAIFGDFLTVCDHRRMSRIINIFGKIVLNLLNKIVTLIAVFDQIVTAGEAKYYCKCSVLE